MNARIDQLVKSLLQKDSLEQCSLPELQQFAERHPYFGAAQLLLTKKMQTENPGQYNDQLQKTLLFYHNPLWVEHLLNDTGAATIIKTKKEPAFSQPAPATRDETVLTPEKEPGSTAPENDPVVNGPEEIIVSAPFPETVTMVSEEPSPSLPVQESPVVPAEPVILSETLPVQEEELRIEIPALKIEPVLQKETELVFEPFHTVDYFASQGIKFREEEKPADKFGKQLKSFTEWLKTLKKVPAAEISRAVEPVAEKKVEEMAETSILDREVLTEAMAEVWEKQGNYPKAIDIYRKLSLLEPAKSTYFAAKIEDLKKR